MFRPRALFFALLLLALPLAAGAQSPGASRGQEVYVPAYTHVNYTATGKRFPLATTVVVHNIDPSHSLEITGAKLYDSEGHLLKEYVTAPLTLAPLAARDLLVTDPVSSPGLGVCFVVSWRAATPMTPPLVEALMIGAQGQQGISLSSQGRVMRELP